VSLFIDDLSQYSKTLSKLWPADKPSHLELLNLLAKSAGFKNYQHLKDGHTETASKPLGPHVKRWLRLFNSDQQALRWPSKQQDRLAIVWTIAHRLPTFSGWTEKEVNNAIMPLIQFQDHVAIRRELIELGILGRTNDGRKYWRASFEAPEIFHGLLAELKLS